MKKGWLMASCLIAAALLTASCAPAPKPAPPKAEAPKVEAPKPAPPKAEAPKPAPVKPQYGGTLTISITSDITGFDDGYLSSAYTTSLHVTNECPLTGDWAKGPAGTGESLWIHSVWDPTLMASALAESWEYADQNTIVLHIRKGVRFHNKPPTSGRELTADDVAFSIRRQFEIPTSFVKANVGVWFKSVEATDKWTVVIKGDNNSPAPTLVTSQRLLNWLRILPRDMIEKYGNMRDWKTSCGTGPFMLVDYVSGASATFQKNPDYWRKDPVHPEYTLPYVDGMKWLIIPDASTRQAALRTAKIDQITASWEDWKAFLQHNPNLQWSKALAPNIRVLQGRVDTGLPFADVRVRRALHMALDKKAIVRDFYGGQAEMLSHPIPPLPEFKSIYIPVDELPPSIRELFEYNPDKAKKLLTEAGYPKGFKTAVICVQSDVDMLSIYKANWAAIGVDLDIQVKESGVWNSIREAARHEQMITHSTGTGRATFFYQTDPNQRAGNGSRVNDPYINERYREFWSFETRANPARLTQLAKEITLHTLEQAYVYPFPTEYTFTVWWPWLKGYHGEYSVGMQSAPDWPIYIWIDRPLKEEMTGKR